jgi:hypothetical protein
MVKELTGARKVMRLISATALMALMAVTVTVTRVTSRLQHIYFYKPES